MWKSVLRARRRLELKGEAQETSLAKNKIQFNVTFNNFFIFNSSKFQPEKDDVAPAGEFYLHADEMLA